MTNIAYYTAYPLERNDGPTQHVVGVVNALSQQGHQVTLFAPSISEMVVCEPSVTIRKIPNIQGYLQNAYFPVTLFKKQFDVLYMRSHAGLFLPLYMPTHSRKILEVNGALLEERKMFGYPYWKLQALRFAERMALAQADKIVVVTEQLGAYLEKKYHIPSYKIAVVENGVDTASYLHTDKFAIRKELQLSENELVFGYVGSLQPWRCLIPLVTAFATLRMRFPDCKLYLVGTGPIEQELHTLIGQLHVDRNIIMVGNVSPEIAGKWMAALDWGISFDDLPFDFGPGSLKIRAYAASGVPQLGSIETSTGSFIEQNNIGIAIPSIDEKEMGKALEKVVGEQTHNLYSANVLRDIAHKQFDWINVAAQIEKQCFHN